MSLAARCCRSTTIGLLGIFAACCVTPPAATATTAALADGSDEAITREIDAITTFPAVLDPRIWNGMDMKPDVRDGSLRIVDRIVNSSGSDDLRVEAVELFGSNASYEYDDSSDFGVHVFVHSDALSTEQLTAPLQILNREVERRQEGHVLFYGVPVEITFHAERTANYQPTPGIGQYSISDGHWVQEPVQQPNNFDRATMLADARTYVSKYNSLVSDYTSAPGTFDCGRFGELDDEMGDYRNQGFEQGFGSRSTQNLTYRVLRRLSVNIPDAVDALEDECTYLHESLP